MYVPPLFKNTTLCLYSYAILILYTPLSSLVIQFRLNGIEWRIERLLSHWKLESNDFVYCFWFCNSSLADPGEELKKISNQFQFKTNLRKKTPPALPALPSHQTNSKTINENHNFISSFPYYRLTMSLSLCFQYYGHVWLNKMHFESIPIPSFIVSSRPVSFVCSITTMILNHWLYVHKYVKYKKEG